VTARHNINDVIDYRNLELDPRLLDSCQPFKTWVRRSAYRIVRANGLNLWSPQVSLGLLMLDLATLVLYVPEFLFGVQSAGPLSERP